MTHQPNQTTTREENFGTKKISLNRRRLLSVGAGIAGAAIAHSAIASPLSRNGTSLVRAQDQGPAVPEPLGPAIPPEVSENANDWPVFQGNMAAQRSAQNSPINSSNVSELEVAWRFPVDAQTAYGALTAPPLVVGDVVYFHDTLSNVYAVERETGELIWEHTYDVPTIGPNGLAIGYGMIYIGLRETAEVAALDAATGDEIWRVRVSNFVTPAISTAPMVYDSIVYAEAGASYVGGGASKLIGLDAATGATLWEFNLLADNSWGMPRVNSGAGLWYPPSVDDEGNLYVGTGNAAPFPGTEEYPNGSSRPGPNDYASSMVSIDSETGALRWNYNARPHDLFDLDFQNTPVLATAQVNGEETNIAIGSGKAGTVVAANRETGEVLWNVEVGVHQNDDLSAVPEGETVEVYPGSLGGVETPLAYADGTVFVPVLNLSTQYTSTEWLQDATDLSQGTGELIALDVSDGSVKWQVDLPTLVVGSATVANDVVFTGGLDGLFRGYHAETGEELWTFQAGAGLNAPPAIAGDLIIIPAGGPFIPAMTEDVGATPSEQGEPAPDPEDLPEPANELIALRLPTGATPAATAVAATAVAVAATPRSTPESGAGAPQPVGEVVAADIVSFDYAPQVIEIEAGTTVEWTNLDGAMHTVTHNVPEGERVFDSGEMLQGDTFQFTFDTPGTYDYFCIPHPFMTATVVVM